QEIVENLNRDLLGLDAQRETGRFDPDLVNDVFRAVHSLKGLAGLFAVAPMTRLSHHLETLLDALRLRKVKLRPEVLDLLFRAAPRRAAPPPGRPARPTPPPPGPRGAGPPPPPRRRRSPPAPPSSSTRRSSRSSPNTRSTACARASPRDASSTASTRRSSSPP